MPMRPPDPDAGQRAQQDPGDPADGAGHRCLNDKLLKDHAFPGSQGLADPRSPWCAL